MKIIKHFTLGNGIKIPALGFGTYRILNGEQTFNSVSFALKNGYRHIDTAHAYGNEKSVGKAVRKSVLAREEIFVTSKLPAEIKTYKGALNSFGKTMDIIGLDYIDLYLIHSPQPWLKKKKDFTKENIMIWKAMEEILESGRCRAIGVSNFNVSDLIPILENCRIRPMVNQIKFFIGYTQEQITLFCKDHNIVVEAYSPLATGSILGNEIIRSIATKYDKTVAQLCIRYIQQRGAVPIPKSVHPNYILQNGDLNFEISDQDMIFLDSLQDTVKLVQGSKKNLQFLNSLKRNTMTIIGPGNYITLKNIVRSILRLKQIIK